MILVMARDIMAVAMMTVIVLCCLFCSCKAAMRIDPRVSACRRGSEEDCSTEREIKEKREDKR